MSTSELPEAVGSTTNFHTILSTVQEYASHDALSGVQPLHPYSSNPETAINMLRNLINTTNDIASSLNAQVSLPLSNPKLLSLCRQQTAIKHTVHNANQTIRQTVDLLRKRTGILYGENIPLERGLLLDWFVSRLETWGTSAGMETFRDSENESKITLALAGKVIVIDIHLTVDRSKIDDPKISLMDVKTSYAVPNGVSGSTTGGSTSLDGFLTNCMGAFLAEIQKDETEQDPEEAARIGSRIVDDLKYLMSLDQLAFKEGDQGLRWFNNIDMLALQAEDVASKEAETVARSISSDVAPLDIFLMRAHALPLPYVSVPSISFLVYLSPLAYLSLLRTRSADILLSNTSLPPLDIPFQHLRARMATRPRPRGATIATLLLATEGPLLPPHTSTMNMEVLAPRPTFILHESGSKVDSNFPMLQEIANTTGQGHRWFLDFTDGGKFSGVVMSQSRMREIEMIVNPLGVGLDPGIPPMSFATGSWVEWLIPQRDQRSSGRYRAVYTSPSGAHPPLKLRLAAPEEPGFFLERVPVRNLKEVWGILEVVREQCWLNETISSMTWEPDLPVDDTGLSQLLPEEGDEQASEAELQAVLEGTNTPTLIPVDVGIPASISPQAAVEDTLFDGTDIDSIGLTQHTDHRTTKIVLSAPEPPPGYGMFKIYVEYDCAHPRGLALKIEGALAADMNISALEEVCRRGGLFGLPGRVWTKLHERS